MLLPVKCEHCQSHYLIEDQFAGRRAKCRKCGQLMAIPIPGPHGLVASSLDDTDGLGTPSIEPGPWGASPVPSPAPAPAPPPPIRQPERDPSPEPPRLPPVRPALSREIDAPHYAPPSPAKLLNRADPPKPNTYELTADDDDDADGPAVDGIPLGQWRAQDVVVEREVDVEEATAALSRVSPFVANRYAHAPRNGSPIGPAPIDGLAPLILLALVGLSIVVGIQGTYRLSIDPGAAAQAAARGMSSGRLWLNMGADLIGLFVLVGPLTLAGIAAAGRMLRFELPPSSYVRACALVSVPKIALLSLMVVGAFGLVTAELVLVVAACVLPVSFFALRFLFGTRWVETIVAYLMALVFGVIGTFAAMLVVGVITAIVMMGQRSTSASEGASASSSSAQPAPAAVPRDPPANWSPPAPVGVAVVVPEPVVPSAPDPVPAPPPPAPSPSPVEAPPAEVEPAAAAGVPDAPPPADSNSPTVFGRRKPVEVQRDFVARVRDAAVGVVVGGNVIPLDGDEIAILRPAMRLAPGLGKVDPQPFALVSGTPQEDVVEVWSGDPPALAGTKSLTVLFSRRANYALSPDGSRLLYVSSSPTFAAGVLSVAEQRELASVPLDASLGTPALLGFVGADRFAIRWENNGKHGLEVWDLKNPKRFVRRIDLPDHDPSPANEAISPDGRLFARAAPFKGKIQLHLHQLGAGGEPRRLPIEALAGAAGFVPASGIAFSPDGAKVAALFCEAGNGVIVAWDLRTGLPITKGITLPGATIPLERVPANAGASPRVTAPSLHWLPSGNAWLVAGTAVVNASTGATIADFDTTGVFDQSVTRDGTIHLAFRDRDRASGIAVLKLDPSKLPSVTTSPPVVRSATRPTTRRR